MTADVFTCPDCGVSLVVTHTRYAAEARPYILRYRACPAGCDVRVASREYVEPVRRYTRKEPVPA